MIARTYIQSNPFVIMGLKDRRSDGERTTEEQENAAIACAIVRAMPFSRSEDIAHLILNTVKGWDGTGDNQKIKKLIDNIQQLKNQAGNAIEE